MKSFDWTQENSIASKKIVNPFWDSYVAGMTETFIGKIGSWMLYHVSKTPFQNRGGQNGQSQQV